MTYAVVGAGKNEIYREGRQDGNSGKSWCCISSLKCAGWKLRQGFCVALLRFNCSSLGNLSLFLKRAD